MVDPVRRDVVSGATTVVIKVGTNVLADLPRTHDFASERRAHSQDVEADADVNDCLSFLHVVAGHSMHFDDTTTNGWTAHRGHTSDRRHGVRLPDSA